MFHMLFVGRFQLKGDGSLTDADIMLAPFMGDRKHIGVGFRDNRQELNQYAGTIGNDGFKEHLAP